MEARTFSPEQLGEWLRVLRGNRSQSAVERDTGVRQYTISNLEAGKTEKPAFEDVVKLALYYGLSPNEIAALAGLFAIPEEDETNFAPELTQILAEMRNLAFYLEPIEQRYFAGLLRGTLVAERYRLLRARREGDDGEEPLLEAPGWLQRRLRAAKPGGA